MESRRSNGILLLVLMLLAPLYHTAAASQPRQPLVQSVDIQIPFAPTPVAIAGMRHLAYELHVTNFRPVDVELLRVDVMEPFAAAAWRV